MRSPQSAEAPASTATPAAGIHGLCTAHLAEIAAIHRAAFPRGLLTHLGAAAVKNYYRRQMQSPHGAAVLGARKDGRLLGYCFLTYARPGSKYVFSGWPPAPPPREMRILAIAADPSLQGNGIRELLADAAGRVALASGELSGALSGEQVRAAFRFEASQVRREFERRDMEISAARYDPSHAFNQHALRQVDDALRRGLLTLGGSPISGYRILDLGCGAGSAMLRLAAWGADPALCHGIDLDPARIERARHGLPAADLVIGDAVTLPWPDASFDLILQSTVFSSILANCVRRRVAAEMLRTLKPGGVIVWHDLRVNNPSNPRVRGIGIAGLRRLFPACQVRVRRTLLAPPVGRLLHEFSPRLAHLLEKLAFLRTHLSGIIVRDPGASC